MTKKIVTMALAAALAATTVLPTVAEAGPRRSRGYDNHHHHGHNGGHHRGRGYYRDGKWIALGILGAAAAAAIANSDDGGCYTRGGRRYCD